MSCVAKRWVKTWECTSEWCCTGPLPYIQVHGSMLVVLVKCTFSNKLINVDSCSIGQD